LTNFNFSTAIIIILKHATTLYASGSSVKSALTQAELDYKTSNMNLNIVQHFTAPPQEYSAQMFVDFVMDTPVCLSFH
jgi:hypothetical protein